MRPIVFTSLLLSYLLFASCLTKRSELLYSETDKNDCMIRYKAMADTMWTEHNGYYIMNNDRHEDYYNQFVMREPCLYSWTEEDVLKIFGTPSFEVSTKLKYETKKVPVCAYYYSTDLDCNTKEGLPICRGLIVFFHPKKNTSFRFEPYLTIDG